jgi:phytoene dehydrogenase-like protein
LETEKIGVMRGREFLMKDLYSFNKNIEEHNDFYEKAKQSYIKIFNRLGLGDRTYVTFASGGSFSKYSHEFQTLTEAGEDTILVDEKNKIAINKEVLNEEVLKDLGTSRDNLVERKSVEVGNIFSLGTRFSDAFNLKYMDENNESKPVIMGSYGIGPGRVMGTVAEVLSDKDGLVWPQSIAPFDYHLISIGNIADKADKIYNDLNKNGVEILYDDRDIRAGDKLIKYLEKSKALYEMSVPYLIEKPFDRLSDFLDPALRKSGAPIELLKNLDSYVSSFFKSKKIHQILEYNVLFLGGSPWISPALYAILTHVDYNLGVWYPKGGMVAVAKLLEKNALKRGIKLFKSEEILQIETMNTQATGLRTLKKLYHFDAILASCDYHHVQTKLIPKSLQTYKDSYWQKKVLAPSALIFMIGTKRKIPNLVHHNLFIGKNWEDHFRSIFTTKTYPLSPSFYVSCSSKDDQSIAPNETDILYILIPVSSGMELSQKEISRLKEYVLDNLSSISGIPIRDSIRFITDYTSQNLCH